MLPLPEPDRDTLVEALAQELAALRVSLPLERAGLERVVDARAMCATPCTPPLTR